MADFEIIDPDDERLSPSTDLERSLDLLRRADLPDEVAAKHRDAVVEFVLGHGDAAERTCREGHLTGSALVVDDTGTRTLLMLHRKLGRWFQPGGHADGDTNLAAVALREASEETGIEGLRVVIPAIDVDVHRVEPPNEDAHLHLDVRFLVIAPAHAAEVPNDESIALAWVTPDDIGELVPQVDDGTLRLVARGLDVAAGHIDGRSRSDRHDRSPG